MEVGRWKMDRTTASSPTDRLRQIVKIRLKEQVWMAKDVFHPPYSIIYPPGFCALKTANEGRKGNDEL
jgi:hypothetical protein